MINCKNTRCRHCFIDLQNFGQLVCLGNPDFITVPDMRVWMLKCNTYKKRSPGTKLRPIVNGIDTDGLYPGQLRPPVDMSDFDAEDVGGPTLDGLDSLKDCKT